MQKYEVMSLDESSLFRKQVVQKVVVADLSYGKKVKMVKEDEKQLLVPDGSTWHSICLIAF